MHNKKSKATWSQCTVENSLAALDFFPIPIPSFNIRGRTKVSSILGSVLSAIVLLVVLFYGAGKFRHLLERSNPTISTFIDRGAVTKHEHLNLRDAGLRFAFAIEGWNDRELKDDPRYAKVIVRQFGRLDGEKYERILPHRRCEPTDFDKFDPPAEEAVKMLEWYKTDPNRNLLCIDWDELGDNIEIFGNWQDESKY